jgi:heme A synthase
VETLLAWSRSTGLLRAAWSGGCILVVNASIFGCRELKAKTGLVGLVWFGLFGLVGFSFNGGVVPSLRSTLVFATDIKCNDKVQFKFGAERRGVINPAVRSSISSHFKDLAAACLFLVRCWPQIVPLRHRCAPPSIALMTSARAALASNSACTTLVSSLQVKCDSAPLSWRLLRFEGLRFRV